MGSCDTAVILTAGRGVRMKSKTTKVLHSLMGKPILEYLIEVTSFLKNRIFVVQEGGDDVCNLIGNGGKIAFQKEVKGTGDALLCAKPFIEDDFVVIPGDVPLLLKNTIKRLISFHLKEKADATILALKKKDPTGYGRIVRSQESGVKSQESKVRIVEERDASPSEKKINLVNSGIYCFNKGIFALLERLDNKNKQREYYLTDVFKMLKNVSLLETDNETEVMGINTRYDLQIAEDFKRKEILRDFMEQGVAIKDLENTYIEEGVKIGRDTIIFPSTFILGKTIIGTNCIIGPSSWIKDTKIEDKARVYFSYVEDSTIEKECNIGPFSYIMPESIVKEKAIEERIISKLRR